MKKQNILFYLGGIVSLVGAVGHMFTSIPAIYGHFASGLTGYWANRLFASLILGSVAQYLTALVLLLGAYFFSQKDKGMQKAGKILLILSLVPHMVSTFSLFTLTPSDWPHAAIHITASFFVILGFLI